MVNRKLPGDEIRLSRPAGVTLIATGVLMIAVINLLRLWEALAGWSFWAGLLPISPLYLAVSGLVWGAAWFLLALGLWSGRGWAARLTPIAAWIFSAYYWLDRLLFRQGAERNSVWFFAAVNLILLAGIVILLRRPRTKLFFGYN